MIVEAPAMRAPCTALRGRAARSRARPRSTRARPSPAPATPSRRGRRPRRNCTPSRRRSRSPWCEDRHDPLLERHHQLGQPADVRVLVDGRAVAQFRHGDEIVGADGAQELTHVRAAAQAAIAGAAVRRARHADAIADLHAPDLGSHGLDDADAAVALDDGHLVHPARAVRRGERRRRRRGRCRSGGGMPSTGGTFE